MRANGTTFLEAPDRGAAICGPATNVDKSARASRPPGIARHPQRFAAAVARAVEVAPHLSRLAAALVPRLPVRARCSQNLRSVGGGDPATSVLWVEEAIDCPWLALDTADLINELGGDVDHAGALDRWLALPAAIRPALVLDPWSGRAATRLPLARPVHRHDPKQEGARIIADLAGRLLAAAMGATQLPAGSVMKNPFGTRAAVQGNLRQRGPAPIHPELHAHIVKQGLCWHTLPGAGPVGLRDVVAALAPQWWHEPEAQARASSPINKGHWWKDRKKRRPDPNPLGRNCILFDRTRFWAYDREEKDRSAILAEAMRLNLEFSEPLPPKEVAGIARSIARFMAKRWNPRRAVERVARGRDRPLHSPDMALSEKQAIAGAETATGRTLATLARLADAAEALTREGKRPTQAALSVAAVVSERRVRELWTFPVRNRSYGALSGDGAAEGAGGRPDLSLSGYAASLWREAQAARAEAAAVAAYDEQAARMAKRGGRPEEVAPRSPDACPAVAEAQRRALAAKRDAERRQAARQRQAEQEAARAERWARYLGWARAGNLSAFRADLAVADDRWRDMAERVAADPQSRIRLNQRRHWGAAAMRRMWKAAKLAAVFGIDHPPGRARKTGRPATRAERFHRPADHHDRAAQEEGRRIEAEREAERRAAEARLALPLAPVAAPPDPHSAVTKPRWLLPRTEPESKHIVPMCAAASKSRCPDLENCPF